MRRSELVGDARQQVHRERRREAVGPEGWAHLELSSDRDVGLQQVLDPPAEEQRNVEGVEIPEGEEHRELERDIGDRHLADGDAHLDTDRDLEAELAGRGGDDDARVEGSGELHVPSEAQQLLPDAHLGGELEPRAPGDSLEGLSLIHISEPTRLLSISYAV